MTPAQWVLVAIGISSLSGVPGIFLPAGGRLGERLAAILLWLGAAVALTGVFQFFAQGTPSVALSSWSVPGGAFAIRLDGLAAFFLVPIFVVFALGGTYGLEYWSERDHPANGRRLRFVYGLMVGGLAIVVVAGNAILFLAGWEVMALAAFMAVGTEDHLPEAREASYLYLVLARLATLCLFGMFALLHAATGSFALETVTSVSPAMATAIFILALLGFGLKAGLMPLHVWLPPAHAAAPSHVSAVMSGVLIKIGIYGLVRVLSLLPAPPTWWGVTLLSAGAASGVLGVAFAIGQHDLKRLLAYHSVENIGIIVMGVGVAVLGRSLGREELVVLGLAGGLLHVWNHGLFKSLLFLCAGAVVHGCHTRAIDQLGGLLTRMPKVGGLFLLGAVAISGLPPLNGFVSELLIYLGLFSAQSMGTSSWLAPALAAPALALIGGLALACFAKVFGAVFLGQPRSAATTTAHEPSGWMLGPMAVLAMGCVVVGLAPVMVAPALDACVVAFAPTLASPLRAHTSLGAITTGALLLIAAVGVVGLLYRRRLRRAPVDTAPTWGCGYAAPSARMQYSSSSFADSLVGLFAWALRPKVHRAAVEGAFPKSTGFRSHVDDTVLDGLIKPGVAVIVAAFNRLRWVQAGNISLYIAYVFVALVGSLVWMKVAYP